MASAMGNGDFARRAVCGDDSSRGGVLVDGDPYLSGRGSGVDPIERVGNGDSDVSRAGLRLDLVGRTREAGVDAAGARRGGERADVHVGGVDAAAGGADAERREVQTRSLDVPGAEIDSHLDAGRDAYPSVDVTAAQRGEDRAVPGQGEYAVLDRVLRRGRLPGPTARAGDLQMAGCGARDEGDVPGILVDHELPDAVGRERRLILLGDGAADSRERGDSEDHDGASRHCIHGGVPPTAGT